MAYGEELAERVRSILAEKLETEDRKMFGGLAFLVRGHMCCGITDSMLMGRIGRDAYEKALEEEHVKPVDFTGRPLKGFVYVEPEGLEDESALQAWIDRCLAFVAILPAK